MSGYEKAIKQLAKAIVDEVKEVQQHYWDEYPENRMYDSFEELWKTEGDELVESAIFELNDEILRNISNAVEL